MLIYMTEQIAGTRPYRMRKRLEDVEETRRRIVEATVELHGTVGPANTTYAGVAALANVQRSTVYRHFPDEEALFGACTSHWFARHPWPRTDEWRAEADPLARLRRGLRELYRYYGENEQMLSNAWRDVEAMPTFVREMLQAQVEHTAAVLLEAWPDPDRRSLRMAISHALDLRTWRSLADAGAAPDEAAELMASMVSCLTR
jgi:AcrR family transcriptional regulator